MSAEAERNESLVRIVVDAWMQHPTRHFLEQPYSESLQRWTRQSWSAEIPLSDTLAAMDAAAVDGARKVLFGTNYPMLTAAACLEGLASLSLDAESERRFLSDNARSVFKLDAAG